MNRFLDIRQHAPLREIPLSLSFSPSIFILKSRAIRMLFVAVQ
jgi:hypothetical protein